MFAKVSAWIKHLPWWGQTIAWPLYGITWLICHILSWAFGELSNRAKVRSRQMLGPLLWPAVGLGIVLILAANSGPQSQDLYARLISSLLLIGAMIYGAKIMISGFKKPKKKKKTS